MGFLRNLLFGKKESTPTISFDEIQSIFRTTLTPLGFEEKEEEGRIRGAQYSRDELFVWLRTDVMDAVYFSGASSKTEVVNDEKTPILDFRIECHTSEANEFKDESVAKLNEWLVKQGLR